MDREIVVDYIKDVVKTYKNLESNLKVMPEQLTQEELIELANGFDDMVCEFESLVELLNEEFGLNFDIKRYKGD